MEHFATNNSSDTKQRTAMSGVYPKLVYSNSKHPVLTFIVEPNVKKKSILPLVNRQFNTSPDLCILTVTGPDGETLKDKAPPERRVVAPVDFGNLVSRGTRIMPVGDALRYVIGNGDLDYTAFQDGVLGRTSFFARGLQAQVYPLPALHELSPEQKLDHDFARLQLQQANRQHAPLRRPTPLHTVVIHDAMSFFAEHGEAEELALDIETTGLDWRTDGILGVSFAFNGHTGYYIPWQNIDPEALSGFLRDKRLILANGKFDLKFLRHVGVRVPQIDFDTVYAGHTVNELRKNSLKAHAWIYTQHGGYDSEIEKFFAAHGGKDRDYGMVPQDMLAEYAATDAAVTYQVAQAQRAELDELHRKLRSEGYTKTPRDYFYETVMPAVNLFTDIEMQGVPIDDARLSDLLPYAEAERDRLEQKFFRVASNNLKAATGGACSYPLDPTRLKININSTQQLALLFEHTLEWEPVTRGKTKPKREKVHWFRKLRAPGLFATAVLSNPPAIFSTDEDCLRTWHKDHNHEEAGILLAYREMAQILKQYGSGNGKNPKFSDLVQPDGCVYPTYLPMYTKTGRTECTKPNLQNQASHTSQARRVRAIFDVPSEDHVIVELDYSNFQLRIAAGLSNDTLMGQVFKSGTGDLHATTARTIFYPNATDAEFEELRDDPQFKRARSKAKAANFGLLFGQSARSLARKLKDTWPLADAKEFVKKKNLGDLRKWLEGILVGNASLPQLTAEVRAFATYWATAKQIREEFFTRYTGLQGWLQRTAAQAHRNGFIVSPLGAIRRLPELRFYKYDPQNMPRRVSGQYNEAVNFPIQNAEAVVIHQGMVRLKARLEQQGLEFRAMTMVHDSLVLYVRRDELNDVLAAATDVLEQRYEDLNDVPFAIEPKVADPRAGTPWGFGIAKAMAQSTP